MEIRIPELSLVLLVGPSGAGKSSFAHKHFRATEIVSSDTCRGIVSDNENDQAATPAAFELLNFIIHQRLRAGRLTVVDATNVRPEDRKALVALAREHDVLAAALVFDLPERICHDRNAARPDRQFGPHVVRNQKQALRRGLRGLKREGFRYIATFESVEQVDAAVVVRTRLWNDRRDETGPFDIIGDVHGCHRELVALLHTLGYTVAGTREKPKVTAPAGRRAIFVGDLVDRGPDSPAVLYLAMHMVETGTALCVPGNHDVKLQRKLSGKNVQLTHGLAETMEQLEQEPEEAKARMERFIDALVSHYVLDEGRLVVAHAGLKEAFQGRASGRVRDFALYGETTGETDGFGLPVRYDWVGDYRGEAMVVYGHTPVPEAEWINRTLCVDTGCVFGGKLTALRYPERELVSVPAERMYYEPIKPFEAPAETTAPPREPALLDLEDVLGKKVIETRHFRSITIREENARAALEVMSRFAVDPRWLVYLPPTMAPPETAPEGDYLERPGEAFTSFRKAGVNEVVCEEKHMGSRAVVVLCRDSRVSGRRFGIDNDGRGVIYTRTGRRFFNDPATEEAILQRLDAALTSCGLWETIASDWIILDCELMPWSAKAQELLREQYAPTGAAASAVLKAAEQLLQVAGERGVDVKTEAESVRSRRLDSERFVAAYSQYCWPVESIADYRIAPFHVLAFEGTVGLKREHRWHLDLIDRMVSADPALFTPTRRIFVDLNDEAGVTAGTAWWHELTAGGGEGMVIKPANGLERGKHGLLQPAIKCRGREYLRIIYGPEYTEPANLERLRQRSLRLKQSLALREFSLGLEALERFNEGEPLYRVHECVFGVLALESEPVDARL